MPVALYQTKELTSSIPERKSMKSTRADLACRHQFVGIICVPMSSAASASFSNSALSSAITSSVIPDSLHLKTNDGDTAAAVAHGTDIAKNVTVAEQSLVSSLHFDLQRRESVTLSISRHNSDDTN
jgi:fatty acid-binding protein DegV